MRNILHELDLAGSALGQRRVLNMPGLFVPVGEMPAALRRVCGDAVADRICMARDPAVEAIVNSWPGAFAVEHATALGFTADTDFEAIVCNFLREYQGN